MTRQKLSYLLFPLHPEATETGFPLPAPPTVIFPEAKEALQLAAQILQHFLYAGDFADQMSGKKAQRDARRQY